MQSATTFLCVLAPLVLSAAPRPVPEISRYGSIPLYFEKNTGQADHSTLFTARSAGVSFALQQNGAALSLAGADNPARIHLEFVKSNPRVAINPEDPLEGHTNYYFGDDPNRWITGVPQFGRVRYRSIYPGVDLVWHASGQQLEYDLDLQPGADPARVRLRFTGADAIKIAGNGDLILRAKGAEMHQLLPAVWQERDGQRTRVEASYVLLASHDVGIRLAGYNHSLPLTIDPILSYATYLGGSGTDTVNALAVDSAGEAYVVGSTATMDFPGTPVSPPPNNSEFFVAKLNAAGTGLVYLSYLGGGYSGWVNLNAIAVDQSGNAYIGGMSQSGILPVTSGAYQTTTTSSSGYIAKLDANGKVVYGTYLGGTNGASVLALALGPGGNIYVTGETSSTDFPTTPAAYQTAVSTTQGSYEHAFMTIVNASGSSLVYSTYLAGSDTDQGNAIAVDAGGDVFVGGQTNSPNFPVTPGVVQSQLKGQQNGFATKFGAAGNLIYSTLLGGSGTDSISAIAIDGTGNAFVGGSTTSTDFPTTPGAFNPSGQAGSFAAELDASASSLTYSTTLPTGSTYYNSGPPAGIVLAPDESLYIAGLTANSSFPTTPGALVTPLSGTIAFTGTPYLMKLSADGSTLMYSTLLSGLQSSYFGYQAAKGIALDSGGNVYVAGSTSQTDMPTTPGAYESAKPTPTNNSETSGFVAKIDMPSLVECSISLSATSIELPGTGGTGSVNVTVPGGCPWEAVPANWITITSASLGTTSGTLSFSVGVNNNISSSQTGTIQFGSATYTVLQDAGNCATPVFNPTSLEFASAGGLRNIAVTLPSPCSLSAVPSAGWIQVNSVSNTLGSGTVGIFVPTNDFAQRSGSVTIASQTVPVTQDAGPCTASVTASAPSLPAAGGAGTFQISTSTPSCQWAVYGVPAWMLVNATSLTGQGNANLGYVVAPNITSVSRSATLSIAGQTVAVSQSAGPSGNIPGFYQVSLFAGTGQYYYGGPLGDGGPATSAGLNNPQGLAWSNGNLYIADSYNGRVRVVTPNGLINTFAGGGNATSGSATSVYLGSPKDLAFGTDGSLYLTDDAYNGLAWKISNGIASVVAGNGTNGSGDQLYYPTGVAVDSSNNLYISDQTNNRVQELSNGTLSTVVSSTSCAFAGDNGPASAASVCDPTGLVYNTGYGLVLADSGNHRLRAISSNDTITTLAGGGSGTAPATGTYAPATSISLNDPFQLTVDPIINNLYFTDGADVWRLITWNNGNLATPLMSKITGGSSGIAFGNADGVAADTAGNVYVSDSYAVWKMTPGYSFCSPSGTSGALTLTPSNGATGVVLNPILTWTTVAGATSYSVNFGTSNPPPQAGTATCTSYSPPSLSPNTTYYWQVAPQGAGSSSAVQSFTTQAVEVGAVTLTLNAIGGGTVTASPSSPDGTYYPGTQICVTATPNPGWVFSSWSGAALNGSECLTITGNTTVTAVFTANISLISPAPGAILSGTLANFSWNAVGGATEYQLSVGTTVGGTNVFAGTTAGTSQSVSSIPCTDAGATIYVQLAAEVNGSFQTATGYTYQCVLGLEDFNHDGHPDLIWQDMTSGLAQIWYLDGSQGVTLTGAANLTVANPWRIVAVADFNGDGNPDVVWQDPVSGTVQVWYMGGPGGNVITGALDIAGPNAWHVAAVADFNGDGHPDLLWQDQTSGLAQIWYMGGPQGNTFLSAVNLTLTNPWRIVGTADFDGDGHPDILWQDPVSGTTQIWYMGGSQGDVFQSAASLAGPNAWKVVAIADFNLDGHPDLVWEDPVSGSSQVWFMTGAQGTTVQGTASLSGANPWRIAGPN